eukprot:6305431-Prymnesium_polylepis.1
MSGVARRRATRTGVWRRVLEECFSKRAQRLRLKPLQGAPCAPPSALTLPPIPIPIPSNRPEPALNPHRAQRSPRDLNHGEEDLGRGGAERHEREVGDRRVPHRDRSRLLSPAHRDRLLRLGA